MDHLPTKNVTGPAIPPPLSPGVGPEFQALLEYSPAAILMVDQGGKIVLSNPQAHKLFGYKPDELTGKPVDILVPDHSRGEHSKQRSLYAKRPRPRRLGKDSDLSARHKDGTDFPVEIILCPVQAGVEFHVITIITDISERKRTEEELHSNEARFRGIFDGAAFGIAVANREGYLTETNPAFRKMMDYTAAELRQMRFTQITHPEDREAGMKGFQQVIARQRESYQVEKRYVRKDGRVVWGSLSLSLFHDAKSGSSMVIAMVEDITERKTTQAALEKSEDKNRALLNAVPDLLIVMSRDGTYLDWKAGENTTPLVPPEEFLGRNITEILPVEVAEQTLHHIRQSLDTGRTQLFVYELLQDDETHSFEARISPCGIDEVLILIRDITESKEQEQSLRDLSQRLLRLQDEERRRIARELHDSSAQSLAALAINLSILKQRISIPDPVTRKALADSTALAKQCSREISNLSHLLHPPLLEEVGLSHALRSHAHGITLRSGIRVDLNLSPQLEKTGQLPRDVETAVFRVAQECLTNIQRHADSATAQVRIELNSTHVRVEAGDQGRGIPPEKLKTARRLTAYRGLGIPGMRERVRQLGGTFQIDTGPRGTEVTVTIPLQEDKK